ncbi:hypothetical protein [Fusobacterium varium]
MEDFILLLNTKNNLAINLKEKKEIIEIKKIIERLLFSSSIEYFKIEALECLYILYLNNKITDNYYKAILERIGEKIEEKEEDNSYFIEFYIKYLFLEKIFCTNFSFEIDILNSGLDKRILSTYYYYLGMYKFYSLNFSYDTLNHELLEIQNTFLLSKITSENRSDSEFYFYLVKFLINFMADKDTDENIKNIKKSLFDWLFNSTDENRELEKKIFSKIEKLKILKENFNEEKKWLNYERKLIDISYLINEIWLVNNGTIRFEEDILKKISQNFLKDLILEKFYNDINNLLPKINSLIENTDDILVKEIFLKLEKELKEKEENFNYENWNKILFKTMTIIDNKSSFNIYNYEIKSNIENKNISDKEKFYNILCLIGEVNNLKEGFETGYFKGDKILNTLVEGLKIKNPNLENKILFYFSKIISLIINYIFNISQMSKQDFPMYYKDYSGKLEEEDFQKDLFSHLKKSKYASCFNIEAKNTSDGGRVDILFKEDDMVFPIEMKKTKNKNLNSKMIEENYIAQAQTYVYPYNELGIFIVIDLSDKNKKCISNDIKDLVNIHHLEPHLSNMKKIPNYVVSFIIPANRLLPSEKSNYI